MYPRINGMSTEFYDSMMNGIVREVNVRDERQFVYKTDLVVAKKTVINSMNSDYSAVISVLDNHHSLSQKQDVWYVMWRVPTEMFGLGIFSPVLSLLAEIHDTDVLEVGFDQDGDELDSRYISVKLTTVKDNPILIDVPGVQNLRSIVDQGRQYLRN